MHIRHTRVSALTAAAVRAVAPLYDKPFERGPSISTLFRGDMAQQGARLRHMIEGAVSMLDRPAMLEHALLRLGQRHAGYGVVDAHYPVVGAALLDALAAGLGDAFMPEVRAAWATMYDAVVQAMREGAKAATLA